jgi:hypothetical protein
MNLLKRLPVVCFLLILLGNLHAQNTNSVYSRYGYGSIETPAFGAARTMGGIGYGYHNHNLINVLNPASYSDVDTMNILFDLGFSGQLTSFKEGTLRQQNPNASFDYAGVKFALKPKWGVGLGLYQYSKVGYSYEQSFTDYGEEELDFVKSYYGTGGLNTAFIGTGATILDGLSVGANFTFTFGSLQNTTGSTFTNSDVHNSLNKEFLILRFPGADFGFQYSFKTAPKDVWTIGSSYSLSSRTNGEYILDEAASDTTETITHHTFSLGNALGVGLSYQFDKRLTLGLDVQRRNFGESVFMGVQDSLKDQTRVAVGMEYLPSTDTQYFYQAMRYRAGFQWTDQYLKVPGKLRSASLSFGLGIPLRKYPPVGQMSMINLGFEVGKLFTPNANMINETYFKMTLGVTFNEVWFFHFKL